MDRRKERRWLKRIINGECFNINCQQDPCPIFKECAGDAYMPESMAAAERKLAEMEMEDLLREQG